LFKSCGKNTYLLGKKAKKLKVKVGWEGVCWKWKAKK
jgi:hypothetical protein